MIEKKLERLRISIRKAYDIFRVSSSVLYYKKRSNNEDDEIQEELLLEEQQQTRGFWLIRRQLKNRGFGWNHKRIYRIYISMKLNLRSKRKKLLPTRVKAAAASGLPECNLEH